MFRLYPVEGHWWSFADYGAVVAVVQRLAARRVLEFGPGWSTLALIEGGATQIDACEDDPHWLGVQQARLADWMPDVVRLLPYTAGKVIDIPEIARSGYDLALIDGPVAVAARLPVLEYALARCAAVLMPVDTSAPLKRKLAALAKAGATIEILETGPLAGAFALITPAAPADGVVDPS